MSFQTRPKIKKFTQRANCCSDPCMLCLCASLGKNCTDRILNPSQLVCSSNLILIGWLQLGTWLLQLVQLKRLQLCPSAKKKFLLQMFLFLLMMKGYLFKQLKHCSAGRINQTLILLIDFGCSLWKREPVSSFLIHCQEFCSTLKFQTRTQCKSRFRGLDLGDSSFF